MVAHLYAIIAYFFLSLGTNTQILQWLPVGAACRSLTVQIIINTTKAELEKKKDFARSPSDYRHRIDNIGRTNRLLELIRPIASQFGRGKPITGNAREQIFELLEQEEKETGYLDFITLSSSLMFSMKYRLSIDEMRKETLYNNLRKSRYEPCPDYLDGLEIVSCDYRELFDRFKDIPGVVFLVDPPYLSTDVGTYRMSWRLAEYLDVLSVLPGHDFIYFTSGKSCIVELCEWLGRNPGLGNPFARGPRKEFDAHMNYNAGYKDIMLYTQPGTTLHNAS